MDAQPPPPPDRRARRLSMALLALWGIAALTSSVGLLILMVSWGTAALHPFWEVTFGVSFWMMVLIPVAVGIWVVARFIRRRGRQAAARSR